MFGLVHCEEVHDKLKNQEIKRYAFKMHFMHLKQN